MADILVRGKESDDGSWVYGWYCRYPFSRWPLKDAIIPAEDAEDGYHHFVEVDGSTVGQFTGRLDKNGKRVFEGDVLDFFSGESRGVVLWSDHDQCYIISPDGDENLHLDDFGNYGKPEYFEVVGNIHDNPELLVEVSDNG